MFKYKCNVKITGAADENLCMKVFDLEQYQRVSQYSFQSIYQHLVTKGLEGIARDRYIYQCMSDPNSVKAYEPLIRFLFSQFQGDSYVDKLYRKLNQLTQGTEEIHTHWLDFTAAVSEYRNTIRTVLRYQDDAANSLINELNDKQIYVKFINSCKHR